LKAAENVTAGHYLMQTNSRQKEEPKERIREFPSREKDKRKKGERKTPLPTGGKKRKLPRDHGAGNGFMAGKHITTDPLSQRKIYVKTALGDERKAEALRRRASLTGATKQTPS